ncbi:MAG: hypothetical protein WCJ13_12215, partial [Coriobacteriia bacterium]
MTKVLHSRRRRDRFSARSGAVLAALILCVACAGLVVPTDAFAITRNGVLVRAQKWLNSPVPY